MYAFRGRWATAVAAALLATRLASAWGEDPKPPAGKEPAAGAAAERTWVSNEWGVQCTRPDDPTWRFVGADQHEQFFSDTRISQYVAFLLLKMKAAADEPGRDPARLYLTLLAYPDDAKFEIEGKQTEASSLLAFSKGMSRSIKLDFKEVKNEKDLGEVQGGYAFAARVMKYGFEGVPKRAGREAERVQVWFFKANRRVYELIIEQPPGEDKALAAELDRVLKELKLVAGGKK
ncbi:MAG: hypothetical protein HZA54_18595 [Planctomycetes bacterium]|nr:hypothetical protein [Planctomycetota bacterium]